MDVGMPIARQEDMHRNLSTQSDKEDWTSEMASLSDFKFLVG